MTIDLPWYYAPGYMSVAVLALAIVAGQTRSAFVAAVLFEVWLLCVGLRLLTGVQNDWPFLAIIDICAAWLLALKGMRFEGLIASTYAIEVLMHISFGLGLVIGINQPNADFIYWWSTFVTACLQCSLVALFVGFGGGKARRVVRNRSVRLARLQTDNVSPVKVADGGSAG